MTRADLIERISKILRTNRAGYWDEDDVWVSAEISMDAETLLDELDRDGMEIVKK